MVSGCLRNDKHTPNAVAMCRNIKCVPLLNCIGLRDVHASCLQFKGPKTEVVVIFGDIFRALVLGLEDFSRAHYY